MGDSYYSDIIADMSEFDDYAEKVKNLKDKPTDEQLLKLYGLFKQVKVGDNDTARPGMLDFKGKAKWDAWTSQKGRAKEECESEYVELAKELVSTIGLK